MSSVAQTTNFPSFPRPRSTWTWNGGTGPANSRMNWTLTSGPGNFSGYPGAGDTEIVTAGTVEARLDAQFTDNTIDLGGTGGAAAALSVTGDNGISFSNPTFDTGTVLTSAVPGETSAATSVLDANGTFVNDGTILADGPAGSQFTMNIAADTLSGTAQADYAYSWGVIQADAGNSMAIDIGNDAELFAAGLIVADGGTVAIESAPSAIAGGLGPTRGIYLIEGGGTLESNVSYGPNITGMGPIFLFGDSTASNTVEFNNIASAPARVAGFSPGDTIDLGSSLAVGTVVYAPDFGFGLLTLENNTGSVLASLLIPGQFAAGTFAVNNGSADGFTIGTGTDGDTVLTTNVQSPVASGVSGTWQSPASWVGGTVPAASDDATIGQGATSNFTLTTGNSPVTMAGMLITSPLATVRITSDTTSTSTGLLDASGTLDVAAGNTLTAQGMMLWEPSAHFTIAAGATVDLAGRLNPTVEPVDGVWPIQEGDNQSANFNAGTVEIDGALLAGPTAGAGGGDIGIGCNSDLTATVAVNGDGTVIDNFSTLGSSPTSSGSLTLNGPGASWTDAIVASATDTTGYIDVGYNEQSVDTPPGLVPPGPIAAAQLLIENGATMTEQEAGFVGDQAESTGTVTVTSGGLWNMAANGVGFLNVGNGGSGSLSVLNGGSVEVGATGTFYSNGTTFTGGGIAVGHSVGSSGTLTVGPGGQLTDAAGIDVGRAGQGTLAVQNGGTVAITGDGIFAGVSAGSSGTVTVSGQRSLLNLGTSAQDIVVGDSGQGLMSITNGATLSDLSTGGGLAIGLEAGGSGTVVVSGPGALLNIGTAGSGIGMGHGGQGVLDVLAGGTVAVNSVGHGIGIGGTGTNVTGSATILVSGPGALLSTTDGDSVFIGLGGTGTLSAGDGGNVAMGGTLNIAGTTAAASGVLDILAGGTVTDGGGGTIFIGGVGSGTLDIAAGGIVNAGTGAIDIDSLGSVIGAGRIEGSVLNDGEITATGGTLEITDAITGTGGITLAADSSLLAEGAVGTGQSVTFDTGTREDLVLGTPGTAFASAIQGFANGDTIEFGDGMIVTGASVVNTNTIAVDFTGGGTAGVYDLTDVGFAAGANEALSFGFDPLTRDSYITLGGQRFPEPQNPVSQAGGTVAATTSITAQTIGSPNNLTFIYPSAGSETLAATSGPDVFVENLSPRGNDVIAGFNVAQDVVQLSAAMFSNFAAVEAATTSVDGSAVIHFDSNDPVTLQGVAASSLQAQNFTFV
jgi:T5SS/PEP-CTERM-associated repeat protein